MKTTLKLGDRVRIRRHPYVIKGIFRNVDREHVDQIEGDLVSITIDRYDGYSSADDSGPTPQWSVWMRIMTDDDVMHDVTIGEPALVSIESI